MPIVDTQDVWKTGARVYVIEETNGPLLDLGTIQVVSPSTEVETSNLEDSDGGVKRTVIKEVSRFTESYEITLHNLNMRNLRYLFFANALESFSQAATTMTSLPLPIYPGQMVKIREGSASGDEYLYNLASILAVRNAAGTAITESTNGATTGWEANLDRGIITLGEGVTSGTTADPGWGEIDLTLNALSGNRLIYPQTKLGNFEGTILLVWGRGNNSQQTVREFTGQITPGTGAFSDTDYSNFPITIEVLNDLDSTTRPAGRMLYFKGDLPSAPQ